MASYDEALQKMYSDRLTRFYRNYDEAKVASVPTPCGNQNQPVAARTPSDDSRRWRIRALTRRGDGVKLGPLLLQWRPVATKRSLMLACSVVVQSSLRSSRKAMLQLSLIDHPGHHRRVTSPPIRCD